LKLQIAVKIVKFNERTFSVTYVVLSLLEKIFDCFCELSGLFSYCGLGKFTNNDVMSLNDKLNED